VNLRPLHTLVLFALLLGAGGALADASDSPVREAQIKSAFLYNFTKFVEWPSGSVPGAGEPIVIGILGESALADEVRSVVADRKVNGHPIVVVSVQEPQQATAAHVLFVSAGRQPQFNAMRTTLADLPVLTVGESPSFAADGGGIGFVTEGDKLRFEINIAAAERARLKISAQLQKLATAVLRSR
jgi:hypothetical protein